MPSTSNSARDRLPPNQSPIERILRWGIDHPGITPSNPKLDLKTWTLTVDGEVEKRFILTWDEFRKLPMTESVSDFHCVEGWSVLDCRWEGVRFDTLRDLVRPKSSAKAVTFGCADGYKTSLTLEELSERDVILACKLNGSELELGYGWPMRLVVPSKYGYKSALWVTKITFSRIKELGYWEKRGYSDTADVWKDDRFSI